MAGMTGISPCSAIDQDGVVLFFFPLLGFELSQGLELARQVLYHFRHAPTQGSLLLLLSLLLVVLGFELRASQLLGKYSTIWATLFFPRASLGVWPFCFLPSQYLGLQAWATTPSCDDYWINKSTWDTGIFSWKWLQWSLKAMTTWR
jgi:hypothetical protein